MLNNSLTHKSTQTRCIFTLYMFLVSFSRSSPRTNLEFDHVSHKEHRPSTSTTLILPDHQS
ncbi:hypothetical protein K443DRAFT_601232 [Laccaria amethystina LaAM-08-1]|uniref:Uncharacterized protein n=1 Tax=Laccaria amethystina LaAM-08-1 TaxID=1095629 RepID=A0A0C9XS40_9AGAR|nr:hypothetical protein K443DRAFT_601232 [Laccaria amethystina LaAM-08-1]